MANISPEIKPPKIPPANRKKIEEKRIVEQLDEEIPDMKAILSQKSFVKEDVEEDLFSDIDT